MHKFGKKTVAVAAGAALFLGGGVAWAYWTYEGSGTGEVSTASGSHIVVTGQGSTALAPGGSSALSGTLTNPNTTSVKVGVLTAKVTTVPAGVSAADFTISGTASTDNTIVVNGSPVSWTGLTLKFADTAVNQDAAKNVRLGITYTLAPFAETHAEYLYTRTVAAYSDFYMSFKPIGVNPTGDNIKYAYGASAADGLARLTATGVTGYEYYGGVGATAAHPAGVQDTYTWSTIPPLDDGHGLWTVKSTRQVA